MLRLILLAVLMAFVLAGVVAVALFHFLGWKGLIAFPFIALALIWLAKILIGKAIKGFALGLFSMKSGVLKGAALSVHSVVPVPKPIQKSETHDKNDDPDSEPDPEESSAETEPAGKDGSQLAETSEEPDDEEEIETQKEKHYYAVDLTITPAAESKDRVWEPGEFILASQPVESLDDLESREVGTSHEILIWKGTSFGPDDECKYPGEQRLKVTFEVKPGTPKAWLQYYNQCLGSFDLPPWEPSNNSTSPT